MLSGANLSDVANAGRWTTVQMLMHYLGVGSVDGDPDSDLGAKARLLSVWVFRKVAVAGDVGADSTCNGEPLAGRRPTANSAKRQRR